MLLYGNLLSALGADAEMMGSRVQGQTLNPTWQSAILERRFRNQLLAVSEATQKGQTCSTKLNREVQALRSCSSFAR